MLAREYKSLFQTEEHLWWFRALRLFLFRLLPKPKVDHSLALDVGCGTGMLLSKLTESGYCTFGLDYSSTALKFAAFRESEGLVLASANHLPFHSAFDLVVSVDVLEVDSVDPQRLIHQAVKALKPDGLGLFIMAAHQWLLSEHDRAVHSVRRFNLGHLRKMFYGQPVTIQRATYLFSLLFPLLSLHKLLNPSKHSEELATSDVSMPRPFINSCLFAVCWCENLLLRLFNLPLGSSIAILVKKNG